MSDRADTRSSGPPPGATVLPQAAAGDTGLDPLDRVLRRATGRSADPKVRRWLERLLRRGETASGGTQPAGPRGE
jgi:hypothetical protein